MNFETKKLTIITVEITLINTEQLLNTLWKNEIRIDNIKRIDAATFTMEIYGEDYEDVKTIVKRHNGKIKILKRRGFIAGISKIKKRLSFIVGGFIFLLILFMFSTRIWAIDIKTEKNVSPFEVRKILSDLGIKQGLSKNDINVYEIEKKLEDLNSEILWVRARMEGSSLKLKIEEKINPPVTLEGNEGEVVAKKDGEVKRVYTESGTAAVNPGDMVKKGDVLILPYNGLLEEKYETSASGVVIANVFYERSVEVQINGEKLERTGKKDSDIYLNIYGKKIYLKKSTNSFKNYDKIEDNNGIFNSITYYEIENQEIDLNKDEVIEESVNKLEKFLTKDLTNEAKVVKRNYDVEDIGDGKIKVIARFIVEEDIAS